MRKGRCLGMKCKTSIYLALVLTLAVTQLHCSVNPFDESQVPIIELFSEDSAMRISWTPSDAWRVRIYEGNDDGSDGYAGLVWSATYSEYENGISSPFEIGSSQTSVEETGEAVFEAGELYTITVRRKDPKGSGDGFSNTRNNYIGRKTFVAN